MMVLSLVEKNLSRVFLGEFFAIKLDLWAKFLNLVSNGDFSGVCDLRQRWVRWRLKIMLF
jgi:hypothetical protein